MFESFNVPSLYISDPAVESILATGNTTGILVDSGSTATTVVPVLEGYRLPFAVEYCKLGGKHVTSYLEKLLSMKGYSFKTTTEKDTIIKMKERKCYVALNLNEEIEKRKGNIWCQSNEDSFILFDGNKINIDDDRFKCTEVLFKPEIGGFNDVNGIHTYIKNSIDQIKDMVYRSQMYKSIVLAGSNSSFDGLIDRVQLEVKKLAPENQEVHVIKFLLEEPKYCAWLGGSILGTLDNFPDMTITRDEYNDCGSRIILRKFL